MQEDIEHIILKHSDIDWRDLLIDLVHREGMDPWDINITLLTEKFIKTIQMMQEADLKISGKMFLAAAMLFKLKSHHLLEHDISKLDELLNDSEEEDFFDEFDEDYDGQNRQRRKQDEYTLIRRNPQPRNRKVSIHDLVDALQKAMKTRRRKLQAERPNFEFKMPEGGFDISHGIRELFNKISYYTKKKEEEELTFTSLLPPKAKKQEKVHTFIPLLHLENEKKVDTTQLNPFEEIYVRVYNEKFAKKKAEAIEEAEKKFEAEERKRKKEERLEMLKAGRKKRANKKNSNTKEENNEEDSEKKDTKNQDSKKEKSGKEE